MTGLFHKTWRLLLVPLAALAFFLGAYFFFHRGDYDPPPTVDLALEGIAVPASSYSTFTEVPSIRRGTLLVDGVHGNDFTKGEISVLLSRVADRGYDIEFVGEAGRRGRFGSPGLRQRLPLLEETLRRADSFAVFVPDNPYTREEVDVVERYIGKGGKLLLIAEPSLNQEINSLAERFGIAFQPDYLWNMLEHDLNFQNIFIKNFRPDEVTKGLAQITLYVAGSIKSSGGSLAFTDGNTRSSIVERIEPFYPMVKTRDGLVLAISDLTFMVPPQNSVLDNDRLVSNIADYLTTSRRVFELADFPHFFKGDVDILLGRPDIFGLGTTLKRALADFQVDSEIRGVEDLARDTVFLGLYVDSADVTQYLEVAGIQVNGTLRTPFTPDITVGGTAMILLHRAQDRYVLVVLANSETSLSDMVKRLGSGQFRNGLVSELLGIYESP